MQNNITEYLLFLILALIWSASFLLIKIGVETIPPFTLTAARLSIAALLFGFYLLLKREWIPMDSSALILYLGSAVLGNSLPFLLISWGETHISSSLAAISMGIMPISTFVLAHFLVSDEPMTNRKTLGILLGFIGLIILVGPSAFQGAKGQLMGILAVLTGALSYSFGTIFVRLRPSFIRFKMAAGTTICAALISLPVAFVLESPLSIKPSQPSMLAVVILAVFPTALASLIYFRIIKTLGATTFAQINYIIPVLGGLWGIILLGERLSWNVFIALALVLFGIYLIQSRKILKK